MIRLIEASVGAIGTAALRRVATGQRGTPKSARTRELLVGAARVVFDRRGYFDASVDDIVQEAGIARGSFYTYFESKADVYAELLERHKATLVEMGGFPRVADNPVANVERGIRSYLELVRRDADLFRLVREVGVREPATRQQISASHWRFIAQVERAVTRWQREGWAERDRDPAWVAQAVTSLLRGFAEDLHLDDPSYDLDAAVVHLTHAYAVICGLRSSHEAGSVSGRR